MSYPTGRNALRATEIAFTSTISVQKADLDRAIGGGLRKGGQGGAAPQEREELFSTVYYRLSRHFGRGGEVTGKISSLAFAIARNVARDAGRQRDRTERASRRVEDADLTSRDMAEMSPETAEARIMRLADTEMMGRTLAAALARISPADRAALVTMFERDKALPRKTVREITIANAAAQREKRARDRLARAVRSREAPEI